MERQTYRSKPKGIVYRHFIDFNMMSHKRINEKKKKNNIFQAIKEFSVLLEARLNLKPSFCFLAQKESDYGSNMINFVNSLGLSTPYFFVNYD